MKKMFYVAICLLVAVIIGICTMLWQSNPLRKQNMQSQSHQPNPAINDSAACRLLLQEITATEADTSRVRNILEAHLHWGIAPHMNFSTRTWNDRDVGKAFSYMSEDDIPILVNLIGNGQLDITLRVLAVRVLSEFSTRALPCVEAGIDLYGKEHIRDFEDVKFNIRGKTRQQNNAKE